MIPLAMVDCIIRPMFQDLINQNIPQYKVYHALITPSLNTS